MVYRTIEAKTKREFREFIRLPYRIYKGNTCWVPPIESEVKRVLNPEKNPYFLNASLALFNTYRYDSIVARCAVIVNRIHHQKYGIKNAFFGFFESINSDEAVKSLFTEIEKYCREKRIELIEGPFNPNLYSELGLLTDNFDSTPSFFQTYNPPYYKNLLEKTGFSVLRRLNIRSNKNAKKFLTEKYPDNLFTESNDMKIRSFNIKRKEEDLDYLREIYNDAFSDNWYFIPVCREEYIFSAKYLNLVTPPELIKFVEYKDRPVGVIHFALDINPFLKTFNGKFSLIKYIRLLKNKKKIKRAIVFAVGIMKEFRHTEAYKLLHNASVLLARNFDEIETTWMYDDNSPAVKAADSFGMSPGKNYLILGKRIDTIEYKDLHISESQIESHYHNNMLK